LSQSVLKVFILFFLLFQLPFRLSQLLLLGFPYLDLLIHLLTEIGPYQVSPFVLELLKVLLFLEHLHFEVLPLFPSPALEEPFHIQALRLDGLQSFTHSLHFQVLGELLQYVDISRYPKKLLILLVLSLVFLLRDILQFLVYFYQLHLILLFLLHDYPIQFHHCKPLLLIPPVHFLLLLKHLLMVLALALEDIIVLFQLDLEEVFLMLHPQALLLHEGVAVLRVQHLLLALHKLLLYHVQLHVESLIFLTLEALVHL